MTLSHTRGSRKFTFPASVWRVLMLSPDRQCLDGFKPFELDSQRQQRGFYLSRWQKAMCVGPTKRTVESIKTLRFMPQRSEIVRSVEFAWKVILIACSAAMGKSCYDLTNRRERKAAVSLFRMAEWLVKVGVNSGTYGLFRELKAVATAYRNQALGLQSAPKRFTRIIPHLGEFELAQLSYLGRSLPEGDILVQNKTVKAHWKSLTRDPVDEVPDDVRLMVAKLTRELVGRCDDIKSTYDLPTPSLSGGASLGSNVARGGSGAVLAHHAQAVTELEDLLDDEFDFDEEEEKSLPNQAEAGATIRSFNDVVNIINKDHKTLHDAAIISFRSLPDELNGDRPLARQAVIPERGYKARIVTLSNARLVNMAQRVRRWLFTGLRRLPQVVDTLRGDHHAAVQGMVQSFEPFKGLDYCVLSADLTTASDLLPASLLDIISETLRLEGRRRGLQDDDLLAIQLALGPHRLVSHIDGQIAYTVKGALMGLPLTWIALCLINTAWYLTALKRHGLSIRFGARSPHFPFRICGDDLLAICPRVVADTYATIVGECGGKISKGKHFVCELSPQRSGIGVFLEEHWKFSFVSEKTVVVKHLRCLPLKGICGNTKTGGLVLPEWYSVCETFTTLSNKAPSHVVRRLLNLSHPGVMSQIRRVSGYLAGLPWKYGGFGVSEYPTNLPRGYRLSYAMAMRRFQQTGHRPFAGIFSNFERKPLFALGCLMADKLFDDKIFGTSVDEPWFKSFVELPTRPGMDRVRAELVHDRLSMVLVTDAILKGEVDYQNTVNQSYHTLHSAARSLRKEFRNLKTMFKGGLSPASDELIRNMHDRLQALSERVIAYVCYQPGVMINGFEPLREFDTHGRPWYTAFSLYPTVNLP
jgi:hypothetical protein